MSWQDELRRLDTELAEGRITGLEHRKKRDELLASASGGNWAPPVATPRHRREACPDSPQIHPPVPPPNTASSPWPEVSRNTKASSVPRYTAPSPADHQLTTAFPVLNETQSHHVEEPTKIRPAVYPPKPQEAPLSTRELLKKKRPAWPRFAFGGLALILMAGIGGFLWLGSGENHSSAPAAEQIQPREARPVDLATLPALPGMPDSHSSTLTVDKALELALVVPGDAEVLNRNGASDYLWKGSSDHGIGYIVAVATLPNAEQASKATDELINRALAAGYQSSDLASIRPGLAQLTAHGKDSVTDDVFYSSANYSVRVTVLQQPIQDEEVVRAQFEETIRSVLAALPKSG